MPMHRSLGDIATDIASRGLPTLFIDTCATLDVVRCAARGRPRVAAIIGQCLNAQAAEELQLIAPSVLAKEASRNRVEVESDAKTRARAVDEAIAAHLEVAKTLGAQYPHTADFSHETLIGPLLKLHDQLLAACTYVVLHSPTGLAALLRAGDNRRPARKGGGANDCMLFEEFLSIARAAPAADPLVLLTTNTDDFGDKGSPNGVHPDLADELAGTRAQICLSWDRVAALVLSPERLKSL